MLRVILVEPEHELNVGSAARAMKNFGCTELWLVRPACKLGFEATKFAKHSKEVLDGARTVKTLATALKGVDVAVGTTGVVARFSSDLKNLLSLRSAVLKLRRGENIAVVFGGEARGLSKEELMQCDLVAHVPTSGGHTVLNLSHAVAVVLYEFFQAGLCGGKGGERGGKASAPSPKKPRLPRAASRADRLQVEKTFSELVRSMPVIQNPLKVGNAFKNVLERARPSRDETQTLLAAIGPLKKIAKKTG